MADNYKKYFMEFLGTFFFVFAIGCALLVSTIGVFTPIAIGLMYMLLVYLGKNVSGGHYNPAVSFAYAIIGELEWKEILPYWIFQLLGAGFAAWTVNMLVSPEITIQALNFGLTGMIVAEFLFTFLLALCFLMTANKSENNQYYGLVIGAIITVGSYVVGALSLASFNPAVSFGMGILGLAPASLIIATILTNIVGAWFAAFAYKIIFKAESK